MNGHPRMPEVLMRLNRVALMLVPCLTSGALLLISCHDDGQSPPARPDTPVSDLPGGSTLAPLDLVYVCGNKFLATNSTRTSVQVEYRVVGTSETGGLTLREGPGEDPGYSETELQTAKTGAVELYQDGQLVARRRNEGSPCGASAMSASIAGTGVAEAGSWSAPFPWPIVGLHLSLLPGGKVLSWGHAGTPQVWDPETGAFTAVPSPALLFCAGHSFLSDGRLLVSGGHISDDHGLPDITIFAPGSESWSRSTAMRRGRWYPTNTTLATGEVVILAGRDEAGDEVGEPEVWSSGSVRVLSTAALDLPYYPRTFLAPNGKIFYAGELRTTRYLDPSGSGSWTTVGDRLYGTRDYGAAVMYDQGKILYVGGGRTTNTAEMIDLNAASPAWQWTGSMVYPRRHLNATVLPTGEVLVTGGSSGTGFNDVANGVHAAEIWNPNTGLWTTLASNTINRTYHATSILLPDGRILHTGSGDNSEGIDERNAELFSPPYLFKGARPTITSAPVDVAYGSSFSISSPQSADIAKVSLIRLGSTTHAFDMNQRFQWLSFTRGTGTLTITAPGSLNRTPPGHYMLFILDGNDVPSVAKIIKVGNDSDPVPPPPVTIALTLATRTDATKQYVSLDWTGATGATVDAYRNGGLLVNTANDGHYVYSRNLPGATSYTFTLCQAGTTVCSNEATATFGSAPPPNAPPSANFTSSCSQLACNFLDGSTDSDGTIATRAWNFGDGVSSTETSPSHAYAAPGPYNVTLTVTDDDGASNQRSASVAVTKSSIALALTGRVDATKQYVSLDWTGATGATVDAYRNGGLLVNTANDGHYVYSRNLPGAASYTFKLCQAGTTVCSNEASVSF
jgi:PKD repeat protein